LALGDLHIHNNDTSKAEREFDTAQALSPDTAECARIIADIYRSAKLWQKAAHYYSLALAQNPTEAETLLGLALVRRELGEFRDYKALLDQIDATVLEEPEVHFQIGLIRLKDSEYGPAIDSFARTIRLDPDFYAAYVNMALACKHRGQWQEAIDANLEAIKKRSDLTDARLNLANLYYQIEQFDLAKEHYQKVLEQEPDNLAIRILLCDILVAQGHIHQCHRECMHILKSLDGLTSGPFIDTADLPLLLLRISDVLQQRGQSALSKKTIAMAHQLNSKRDQEPICFDRSSGKSSP
jgi:tetratricopeptide (TPR) repeat protein